MALPEWDTQPPWEADPTPALESWFRRVATTTMADMPLSNPALQVEAVGFRRYPAANDGANNGANNGAGAPAGHWLGVMLTPWAINLLCLPGGPDFPDARPGAKHPWRFPSGEYSFIVAEGEGLGRYHLCSLFSPALEFADHGTARLTAQGVLIGLLQPPGGPVPPSETVAAGEAPPSPARRGFLGLGPGRRERE